MIRVEIVNPGRGAVNSIPLVPITLDVILFARLLYGGRVSLTIGVVGALGATTIGVTLGLIAGYYQGSKFNFVDDFLMWFITTLNSIPTLMLLILIGAVMPPLRERLQTDYGIVLSSSGILILVLVDDIVDIYDAPDSW